MSTHGDSDSENSTSSGEMAREREQMKARMARLAREEEADKKKLREMKESEVYKKARKDAKDKERAELEAMRTQLAAMEDSRKAIRSEVAKVTQGTPIATLVSRNSPRSSPGSVSDVDRVTGGKRLRKEKERDDDEPVKDGKKPVMDSDGNSFRVLNQQVGGENLIKSRFARRISSKFRHEEYFGEDLTKLDADRTRRVIADKMQVSIFQMPRGSMEDWSSLALYKSVIGLPAMSEEGLSLFLEGGCTSLSWFLPKGSPPVSSDLTLVASALKNMEWVFRVVGSEADFKNLSAGILPVLFVEDVLLANPHYVVHWIEARIRAFNGIVSTVYGDSARPGEDYPADLNSVANCRQLWDTLFSSFRESVTERNMRIFKDEEAGHRIHRFSMSADIKLRGDYIGVPGSGSTHAKTPSDRVPGDKGPTEGDVDKPKSKRQRKREKKASKVKEAKEKSPGKDSDRDRKGADKGGDKAEVKPGAEKGAEAPKNGPQGYCGAHLAFLANVVPACARSDCRYLHVQSYARAKLGLVRKVLATKWSESQTQEALDAIDDQAQAECMDKDTKQFVPKALRTPRA